MNLRPFLLSNYSTNVRKKKTLYTDSRCILFSQTNSDGRCPTLLPEGYKAEKGIYRVTFETQAFFSKIGQECFYPYVQVSNVDFCIGNTRYLI